MKIMIAGGTGFIGRALIPRLQERGDEVFVMGRDAKKIVRVFSQTVKAITWDQLDQCSPDEFDAVINLAGENIGQGRWTSDVKKRIKDSRVDATKTLVSWCIKSTDLKKPHLYNASAISIYGAQDSEIKFPETFTESTEINGKNNDDFLNEIAKAWEQSTLPMTNKGMPVTLMRFAPVLNRHEGMLKKMIPAFYFGVGSILGTGKQIVSWIHSDDLVNGILFLLENPKIIGPVNLSAPEVVTQKRFATILAKTMHRPLWCWMPAFFIKLLFGEMGESLLLKGQTVYSKKLIDAGFVFNYPTLSAALQHEWKNTNG